jgi:glycosyltransferase involved in cell wall biosynthesis
MTVVLSPQTDHIHAHFGTNSTAVAMLCHLLGGPAYSFTVHGPEEFERPRELSLRLKTANAKFVVGISEFGRSQLHEWCDSADASKVHVIHCGIGDDFLSEATVPVPDEKRLVCVARLSPQKGLPVLIEASQELANSITDFEIVIIGDGPMRAELEQQIASTGLQTRVRLVGAQTGAEIRKWLEKSRAFVLPSFAEGLPVVIMEAFARARPVISTRVAGIPELVVDGENGWLIAPGSPSELAEAMQQALETPVSELSEMGARGGARVLGHHTISKEVARLAQLFTQ